MGGGHKNRALAHGYSIQTPSGFRPPPLDLVTPGVQQKIWVKISSSEEGGSLITPLLIQADRYPYLLLDTGGADVAEAESSPKGAI